MESTARLEESYAHCRRIALRHYENFPVGSALIPRELRPHFFALYAFMRSADDIADLPGKSPDQKVAELEAYRTHLDAIFKGEDLGQAPLLFHALADTVRRRSLGRAPFDRLLDAFEFDARGDVRFHTIDGLYWYCDRSANPVGELVLALFGYTDTLRISLSNNICTGLQLLNFCQDIREDLSNDRYYFPLTELRTLGIHHEQELLQPDQARAAVLQLLTHVERLFESGAPLAESVGGRLRYELRAIVHAARAMTRKIRKLNGNTMLQRPKLSKLEHVAILLRSLFVPV